MASEGPVKGSIRPIKKNKLGREVHTWPLRVGYTPCEKGYSTGGSE